MSNADDAANIYMNASGIFDVVVEKANGMVITVMIQLPFL
jgi:hypothetical protein